MDIFHDRYNFRTRIIPQFLAVLPFCLLVMFYMDFHLNASIFLTVLLGVFVSWNFASSYGAKIERECEESGDIELLCKYISRIQKQKQFQVTDDERLHWQAFEEAGKKSELDDPFATRDKKEIILRLRRIENWLREKTRDKDQFPVVFDKNCSYGFYRNMLAMRKHATALNALSLYILLSPILIDFFFSFNLYNWINIKINYITMGFITFAHLALASFWYYAISLDVMKIACREYVDAILRSVDGIEEK